MPKKKPIDKRLKNLFEDVKPEPGSRGTQSPRPINAPQNRNFLSLLRSIQIQDPGQPVEVMSQASQHEFSDVAGVSGRTKFLGDLTSIG